MAELPTQYHRYGINKAQADQKAAESDDILASLFLRHLRGAVNQLVLNQLDNLQPTVGDAPCAMLALLLSDMREAYEKVALKEDVGLVGAYLVAHGNDEADTDVLTVEEAHGAAHDSAYDDLVERVCRKLGERDADILGACYTLFFTHMISHDELHNSFPFRTRSGMLAAFDHAVGSAEQKHLAKLEAALDGSFFKDSVDAFIEKFEEVPRHAPAVSNAPQSLIENQLSQALQTMGPPVPFIFEYGGNVEHGQIRLPPMFNQILAMLYMIYNNNGGILTLVRLEKLTLIPEARDVPDSEAGEKRYTRKLAGVSAILWKPNHETGNFDPVEVGPEEEDTNCLVLDGLATVLADSTEEGLQSSNIEEYESAFKKLNIVWLALMHAASRPEHCDQANDQGSDYPDAYDKICTRQNWAVDTFKPTGEGFPEFHLRMHVPGEIRPNLYNLWTLAKKTGEEHGLDDDSQPIKETLYRGVYKRTDRPAPWRITNISAATPRRLFLYTEVLKSAHAAAPNARLGPYLVLKDATAFSFEKLSQAEAFLNIEDEKDRIAEYLKLFPGNAPFVE